MRLFPARRHRQLLAARQALHPRAIEIHSVTPVPAENPRFHRVAFTFKDPPGPYSLQFYEAASGQDALLARLGPGTAAAYYESRDEARMRLIETTAGEPLWPR
ncbi:MAG: hypothetical protein PWP23_1409 [Candidatus Sumerlaeota bacterium]|nr:hypothetical protein [Candidatus Sumerlaeota bacterium]